MKHLRPSILLALLFAVLGVAPAGAAVPVDPSCPATVAPPQGSVRACSPGHLADVLNSDFRGLRAVAVGFAGDRLAPWTGFGLGSRYSIRSRQDMR